MQLPKELQKFPLSNLIVASDSTTARIYLAGGDSLEELDAVSVPHERKQDNEGSFVSSDGSRVGGPIEEDDTPRFDTFIKKLARSVIDTVRKHKIEQLSLVMPAEVEHALVDQLPSDVDTLIRRKLHKDLMKEAPIELVKRLLEA
ncbi:MAG: host attachment protein [Patescibacteria group bacterium]|nr:host attachment protein [Patescibacteria group bacterium]